MNDLDKHPHRTALAAGPAVVAAHLDRRRRAMLQTWRRRVDGDPVLADSSKLSRSQFEDHIPEVLDALSRRLTAVGSAQAVGADQARADARRAALEHGAHRWQLGYDQRQTLREWRHLQMAMLDEVDRFASRATIDPDGLRRVRREVCSLCMDGAEESLARYVDMKQAEAASRLADLERAIARLSDMEMQRLDALREAAHDLRGNVATLRTATAVLAHQEASETVRTLASGALMRGVQSLHELLNDLLDLSRLEAGLERRRVEGFDAGAVLTELCAGLLPVAMQKGLYLRHTGPASLRVAGDPVKVMRIAQNLIHNAVRYTERGGVDVRWQAADADTPDRWTLHVIDTGPGLEGGGASPIAIGLREATRDAGELEDDERAAAARTDPIPRVVPLRPVPAPRGPAGEGLGLSIVKRLCELLDASLELRTSAGEGTAFTIRLPVRYDSPAIETPPAPE